MSTKNCFRREFEPRKKQLSYGNQLVKQAQQCLEKKAQGFKTERAERVLKAIVSEVLNGNLGSLDYLNLIFQEELSNAAILNNKVVVDSRPLPLSKNFQGKEVKEECGVK